jgi:hypothetical protein
MAEQNLIDRYQDYRTRRFLKRESAYANKLVSWRTQERRRALVIALAGTFAFMVFVSVLCAFGLWWAPLLWFPACLVFFPLWIVLQIVSSRQGDAPLAALDEFELAQRNSARSIGLTVTQYLMLLPIFYLIFGSVLSRDASADSALDMAYAGGLMATTVLLIGGCTPAMILAWTKRDVDA